MLKNLSFWVIKY